jgi:hypothetical protein
MSHQSHKSSVQKKQSKPKKLSGIKYDGGKPQCSLISSAALFELSKVLTFGAKKYSSHNWRGGFKWSRVLDAALRHLYKYNMGELVDEETGISHLSHAFCNLMFLIEFEQSKIGENDLWKGHKKNAK